jgi:hypothetical protein
VARYGLGGGERQTLAQIGFQLGEDLAPTCVLFPSVKRSPLDNKDMFVDEFLFDARQWAI